MPPATRLPAGPRHCWRRGTEAGLLSKYSGDVPSVYVHVGEPKSGTTFLQQVMWKNREALAGQGIVIPGDRPVSHWSAAQDLGDVPQEPNDPFGPVRGSWDRLAAQACRAPRAAIISHELLAAVNSEQAGRAIRSLAGADVHVVLTVRDIATLLPAEWKETVKHRNSRRWTDWLADVIDRESGAVDRRQYWFWRVHDTLEILRIWSAHVPADRVHVITRPPSGSEPNLLWHRFASVVGIPESAVDTGLAWANRSLTAGETELLRRVNEALPADLPDWFYMRSIKDGVAHEIASRRPIAAFERLMLPLEREEWAAKYAHELITGLGQAEYDVVGELNELLPVPAGEAQPADPGDTADAELVAAAIDAVVCLTSQLADTMGIARGARDATVAAAPPGRFKELAIRLSGRSRTVHRLRRGYWHLANALRQLRSRDRWRAIEDRDPS